MSIVVGGGGGEEREATEGKNFKYFEISKIIRFS